MRSYPRPPGPHWMRLQETIDAIAFTAGQAKAMGDSDGYQGALDRLDTLEDQVGETVDRFMFPPENNPSGSSDDPFIHIQTNPSLKSVQALRDCSWKCLQQKNSFPSALFG